MKANELMIGDWVDFYHPHEPEKKIITRHRITETFECGLVGISDHDNPVHADHIEPVKITQEILEKNEIDTVFKTRYKGFYLEYHAEAGMIVLYVYNNGFFQPTGIGFKYVHELQHAFRLAGIDKEIKLED
jgi:hypothetical protein